MTEELRDRLRALAVLCEVVELAVIDAESHCLPKSVAGVGLLRARWRLTQIHGWLETQAKRPTPL